MGGEAVRDIPEAVYYTARGRIVAYGKKRGARRYMAIDFRCAGVGEDPLLGASCITSSCWSHNWIRSRFAGRILLHPERRKGEAGEEDE